MRPALPFILASLVFSVALSTFSRGDDAQSTVAAKNTTSSMNDPAAAFYDPRTVQTVHLEINAADLEQMHRALPKRISVPGTFRWNADKLEKVGIRYKGNS